MGSKDLRYAELIARMWVVENSALLTKLHEAQQRLDTSTPDGLAAWLREILDGQLEATSDRAREEDPWFAAWFQAHTHPEAALREIDELVTAICKAGVSHSYYDSVKPLSEAQTAEEIGEQLYLTRDFARTYEVTKEATTR